MNILSLVSNDIWNLSSAGRASALQAGGHRFEPYRSHFSLIKYADVAQLAEQLICNQQVNGSSPFIGFLSGNRQMGGFPSGQRGQTVNLLHLASMVRIHHHPLAKAFMDIAGWSSLEARRAHNPEVTGSNPVPATHILLVIG